MTAEQVEKYHEMLLEYVKRHYKMSFAFKGLMTPGGLFLIGVN